jgi:hypothetical protein
MNQEKIADIIAELATVQIPRNLRLRCSLLESRVATRIFLEKVDSRLAEVYVDTQYFIK